MLDPLVWYPTKRLLIVHPCGHATDRFPFPSLPLLRSCCLYEEHPDTFLFFLISARCSLGIAPMAIAWWCSTSATQLVHNIQTCYQSIFVRFPFTPFFGNKYQSRHSLILDGCLIAAQMVCPRTMEIFGKAFHHLLSEVILVVLG